MTPQSIFSVKPSVFGRRRHLRVHPDFLSFEAATITRENMESFRFGVDRITGLYFIIGRTYRIEIRDHEGQIIKIRLHSIYGIRKKQLSEKYSRIYQVLHDTYFNDLGVHYVKLIGSGLAFTLAGVTIGPQGIADTRIGSLPWHSVGLRAYHTYFSLYDKTDPTRYRAFDYGIEWNAVLLYMVLDYITQKELSPGLA